MESKAIINVNNLNLWYSNHFKALNNINTIIYEKKVTSLIGPSGCGKTTFLRCLNRLNEEIDQVKIDGHIHFMGENIFGKNVDPVTLRRKIGMVFQQPNPFPSMSIYENVAIGLKLNKLGNKKQIENAVIESLQKAALWEEVKDKLTSSATSLSGGQAQRLCIARAIASIPEIILMDEPTSALDPIATVKIEELIQNLKKYYTVIIVTHNMQQARRVSDETRFFVLGELLEGSTTDQFFTSPSHPQSQAYISGKFS